MCVNFKVKKCLSFLSQKKAVDKTTLLALVLGTEILYLYSFVVVCSSLLLLLLFGSKLKLLTQGCNLHATSFSSR